MRNAMRYRGSMRRARSFQVRDAAGVAVSSVMSAGGFGDRDQAINQRMPQHLLGAGRPVDHDAVDPLATAEPEVQSTVVLAGEAHSAIDDPALLEITRFHNHLSANRAAVAACADEVKFDPVVGGVGCRTIERRRLVLICNYYVDSAAVL